jgi:hypothetical protein
MNCKVGDLVMVAPIAEFGVFDVEYCIGVVVYTEENFVILNDGIMGDYIRHVSILEEVIYTSP